MAGVVPSSHLRQVQSSLAVPPPTEWEKFDSRYVQPYHLDWMALGLAGIVALIATRALMLRYRPALASAMGMARPYWREIVGFGLLALIAARLWS